ncbi:MAG: hypothetical protein JWO19_5252 [Bryobacterales bacterium]|jgi:hypothetical protein|nr:hypothetical protein [Bryobacterales bacterium]
MRFLILPTLTILSGGLLLAADSGTVTYIDGNIADLAPNTGATLYLSNSHSMELRTPLHTVQVPYTQITKAELGPVNVHSSEPEALYKVWALPKRLMRSETRQMTVAFTNGNGQDQTMTIELSKPAASTLFATIERHSGKVANDNWWGDGYWKTTRNKDQWGGVGPVAQK